jgi:hypothetical protein
MYEPEVTMLTSSNTKSLRTAVTTTLASPFSALAQETPAAGAAPVAEAAAAPSMVELKAALYDAQQAAAKAEAEAARTREALEEAEAAQAAESSGAGETAAVAAGSAATGAAVGAAAASSSPALVPAPGPSAEDAARDAELEAAREDVRRATEEARNASAAARAAIAQVEELKEARKNRFARRGFTLSGGAFWAPSLIDTRLNVDAGKGLNAAVGYRIARHFDADLRFDWIDTLELRGIDSRGTLDGWSITLNGRFFLLTGSFQPYLGLGLGAIQMSTRLQELSGPYLINREDTAVLFRPSLGFDFYISERLAITADAAMNLPGGELSGIDFATLGGGLKLRF